MILGLIAPTAGSIELFGVKQDGNHWAALRRIGAIVEEPAFYPYLSGRDNLEVLARSIGGIPKSKIAEELERVNLTDRAKPIRPLLHGDEAAAGYRLDTFARPGTHHPGRTNQRVTRRVPKRFVN